MKLLILGAGGHGRVVRETAEAIGCFESIEFLDDQNPDAAGKLDEYESFCDRFDAAFVAIGENRTRGLWFEKLRLAGYHIPTLIHPRAYISPSATIGAGTIIEPLACINSNIIIGSGCIVAISSVVDHDCQIGDYSHLECGVILKPRSVVNSYIKVTAQT